MNFKYWMEMIASLTPNPSSQGYKERRQHSKHLHLLQTRVPTRDSKHITQS